MRKKVKREAQGADSMYQRLTSKRKAGCQNSGEEIARKLEFEDESETNTDELEKTSSEENTKIIANAVVADYMRRRKLNDKR